MAYRAGQQGFKIVETPIIFMDRRVGKSKMSRKIVIEGFTYVLKARFSRQALKPGLIASRSSATQLQVASIQASEMEELPSVAQQ